MRTITIENKLMNEDWALCKKNGSDFRSRGELAEAIKWYSKALDHTSMVPALDIASLHNIIAALYMRVDDPESAEASARASLRLEQEFGDCGRETTRLATYYGMLARTLERQGKYREAAEYVGKSVELLEALLGPDNDVTRAKIDYYNSLKQKSWKG